MAVVKSKRGEIWISIINHFGLQEDDYMFRRVTVEEQIREERQRALAADSRRVELDELILEQVVDVDFRLSMSELEGR